MLLSEHLFSITKIINETNSEATTLVTEIHYCQPIFAAVTSMLKCNDVVKLNIFIVMRGDGKIPTISNNGQLINK